MVNCQIDVEAPAYVRTARYAPAGLSDENTGPLHVPDIWDSPDIHNPKQTASPIELVSRNGNAMKEGVRTLNYRQYNMVHHIHNWSIYNKYRPVERSSSAIECRTLN